MTHNSDKQPDFIPTGLIQWDSSWPELAGDNERHHLFSYLEDRFGIPESLFDSYLLFKRKKSWSILTKTSNLRAASLLKASQVGLKAFNRVGAFVKPTTRLIQIFGSTATKSRLGIDETQLRALLSGDRLSVGLSLKKGYIILSLGEDRILGLGFYHDGHVTSQIPRKELKRCMF